MEKDKAKTIIKDAIKEVIKKSPKRTDGKWLEDLTTKVSPYIKEWDVARCYHWGEWPEREEHFSDSINKKDIGIDAVALRRSDGGHIAIQCKSRKLDKSGQGNPISKKEIDSFANISSSKFWAERWIITNGNNPINSNAQQAIEMADKPIKIVHIANDLQQQQDAFENDVEECSHCSDVYSDWEQRKQTKNCMQNEAVAKSVSILKKHERTNSGGLPVGQARGRIILPCGTGKTRISLRIVEELTPAGELSIVLCPSIALVAQIRREYLQRAKTNIRPLAVCSDKTAGYNPEKEDSQNTATDPTVDGSFVSESEVKGQVTTDPKEIADWIKEGQGTEQVSVIFGTYQSGSRVAEALRETGVVAKVLIADEAHRTAGLRRKKKRNTSSPSHISEEEKRIRDFTLCHDNNAFPATYRVYQTATPRIYDISKVKKEQPSDWIVRTMDDETIFGVELYRKSYVEAVKNGWLSDYRIIALGINDKEAYDQANLLATKTGSKRQSLTTAHYLKGLAFTLAMGGATQTHGNDNVSIKSCIAFMNTVDKSKNMVKDLRAEPVREWLQNWLYDNGGGGGQDRYAVHAGASRCH